MWYVLFQANWRQYILILRTMIFDQHYYTSGRLGSLVLSEKKASFSSLRKHLAGQTSKGFYAKQTKTRKANRQPLIRPYQATIGFHARKTKTANNDRHIDHLEIFHLHFHFYHINQKYDNKYIIFQIKPSPH